MNTDDIIQSLGMCSPVHMPPKLISEIADALKERDELKRQLSVAERGKNIAWEGCGVISELNLTLREKNERLTATNDALKKANKDLGKDFAKLKRQMGLVPKSNDYIDILLWHVEKNERLTALLQSIHDDAIMAPGGYLVSGGIMREIAEVVK